MRTLLRNFSIFIILICIAMPVMAGKTTLLEENPILGTVNRQKITLDQVNDKDIQKLREKLYEAVQQKFMVIAVETLLKKHPELKFGNTTSITDAHIASFYYQRGLQSQGSIDQLKPAIRNYLEQAQKYQEVAQVYERGLKKGYIKPAFTQPKPWLFKVPIETAYIRGSKKARVMILEFTDYQCPFCGRVQPTLKRLRSEYTGKVAFAYRHFPLAFHDRADEASNAAECAREQGKFGEYHDLLFKNPKTLQDSDLKRYAKKVGMADMNRFNKCVSSVKYKKRIQYDMRVAQENGVSGTPAFFIGKWNKKKDRIEGEFINGAQPYGAFKKLIERYLKVK